MKRFLILATVSTMVLSASAGEWIRVNQLGYIPRCSKVAVMLCNDSTSVNSFEIVDAITGQIAFHGDSTKIRTTGPLGPMRSTFRLDFSDLTVPGSYEIRVGDCESNIFPISPTAYNGAADFVLNYMRQQRCGDNPFFGDKCHQQDAFIVGHPTKDGQHIDVRGGWHDASDLLQYTTTSANAIYQMMTAYKANPEVFGDYYDTSGRYGANGIPDIVDEIYWGLDWLDRMNPAPDEFYNQIADDRDHVSMRRPANDPADYGHGPGPRPVYFCSGERQQRGKYTNATMGVASTTGKYASDFALGAEILAPFYPEFAARIGDKAANAFDLGLRKPGNCQTASVLSPYIYEEDNWVDDMELGAIELYRRTGDQAYLTHAVEFGRREPVTPWMGADSARHYQWYPFMNMGHVMIASTAKDQRLRDEFIRNIRAGIERVHEKAKGSPFLYGIPSIWCSNNLTTAMLTQCILYRQLTGDEQYIEMEGALRDWLFGVNPWGACMIVELPLSGNYPRAPHSSIISLKLGNTTGGLVDGPVYSTIFNSLRGVNIVKGINGEYCENYEDFQPGDMVYHDNTHDYSTNEPTMDGTASLTFPLSAYQAEGMRQAALGYDRNIYRDGAIVRMDPAKKTIALVFTADDTADGADAIMSALKKAGIKGSFFFTGQFFELFPEVVNRLKKDGHYIGSHSYGHLLYMPWENPDSLLITQEQFNEDMTRSFATLSKFGISREEAPFFIPPYEWYNAKIASWAKQLGLQLVNFTPGTGSNDDYTTPDTTKYRSSVQLIKRIMDTERREGLNGHLLMIHLGTNPARTDKLYDHLPEIISKLKAKGYEFVKIGNESLYPNE